MQGGEYDLNSQILMRQITLLLSLLFFFLFFMNITKNTIPANTITAKGATANKTPVTEMSFRVLVNVIVSLTVVLSISTTELNAAVSPFAGLLFVKPIEPELSVAVTVYVSEVSLSSVTFNIVSFGRPLIVKVSLSFSLSVYVVPLAEIGRAHV